MTRKPSPENRRPALIRELECVVLKGLTRKASAITKQCLQAGLSPSTIIEEGVFKALEKVGQKWKAYEYFIPNVLVSAMATRICIDTLQPVLKANGSQPVGKIVAGTVKGDVHDIGKNIVLMFMEASGFEVIDLGIDVAPEDFVRMVRQERPDILVLSCLYTVTMYSVEDTLIALRKSGLADRVKTLIGGAPITRKFAGSIGADGYGVDAVDGVKTAMALLEQLRR